MKKAVLCILMALLMVLTALPMTVSAASTSITGTSTLDKFLVAGGSLPSTSPVSMAFTLSAGYNFNDDTKWQKFVGGSWADCSVGTTIEASTSYRISTSVYIKGDDYAKYASATAITLTIDGKVWGTETPTTGYNSGLGNYVRFKAFSPTFAIETASSLFTTHPKDTNALINNTAELSWYLKHTPDNEVIIQYLDGTEWKYLDRANSKTVESVVLAARSTPQSLTCRARAYYKVACYNSFYATSDTFKVGWHGKYQIKVINGEARDSSGVQPLITEAYPGKLIKLVADTVSGKVFKEWKVTGATVSDNTAQIIFMNMPYNNITAEAIYEDASIGSGGKFTLQPKSGTAVNGEEYNATWALNFTPTVVRVELYNTDKNEWVYSQMGSASGASIGPDWDITRNYRILAYNNGEPVYSDIFTVEWKEASTGYTVSGTVTSFLSDTDTVGVYLSKASGGIPSVNFKSGNSISYSFSNIPAGNYILTLSKKNHVTREYQLNVYGNTTQNVTICPLGDISGDGKITAKDYAMANAHVQKVSTLTGYAFQCGDVLKADGKITAADAARINAHVQKTDLMW